MAAAVSAWEGAACANGAARHSGPLRRRSGAGSALTGGAPYSWPGWSAPLAQDSLRQRRSRRTGVAGGDAGRVADDRRGDRCDGPGRRPGGPARAGQVRAGGRLAEDPAPGRVGGGGGGGGRGRAGRPGPGGGRSFACSAERLGCLWTGLLVAGLALAVAIGLWAAAATAVARHLTLTPRVRAVHLVLGAIIPNAVSMVVVTLGIWWWATQYLGHVAGAGLGQSGPNGRARAGENRAGRPPGQAAAGRRQRGNGHQPIRSAHARPPPDLTISGARHTGKSGID